LHIVQVPLGERDLPQTLHQRIVHQTGWNVYCSEYGYRTIGP